MLENKVCYQEVELGELKYRHNKKVNSYKVEIENLRVECSNSASMSKSSLKLKNDLKLTSNKLERLQSETITLKKNNSKK